MKRYTLVIILLCMLLSGCGRPENPYQVDTVVRIPVDPTEAATAAPTEAEETAAPTEAPAETSAPTEAAEPAETTEPTEGKSGSAGKKPVSTQKSDSPKQESTEPPAAEPETQPPTEAVETAPPTEQPYDPSDYSVGSLEYEILEALNGYRTEAGLSALSLDARLSGIAALRAEECSEVWSHTRPDGREFTTAMSDYGYGFGDSAQCLGHVGSTGGGAAVAAKWMDTDSKSAILNESFTTVGIGISRSGGVTFVAVLLVG